MTRIRVLDPTAEPPLVDPDPGPDAGPLAGRRVGIRTDHAWRSFNWVVSEWIPRFEAAGAEVVTWVAGNRIGDEGARTFEELAGFAAAIDVGIVGLGN